MIPPVICHFLFGYNLLLILQMWKRFRLFVLLSMPLHIAMNLRICTTDNATVTICPLTIFRWMHTQSSLLFTQINKRTTHICIVRIYKVTHFFKFITIISWKSNRAVAVKKFLTLSSRKVAILCITLFHYKLVATYVSEFLRPCFFFTFAYKINYKKIRELKRVLYCRQNHH